ncbi:hypothetical protein [Salinisphaera sp. Q1T1-3]|uniref:hypothetical protein n=1 Tax=Salinisphaera sp. Q1T1-3 TaxID=2321229 RepID=UPI000E7107FF|nr:hypothetical protein [Salinisphaera sp. Q1T1-3]RJS94088.1 hypothetical protein D3260_05835 [Salinisphaera sp. Q1T1-3]
MAKPIETRFCEHCNEPVTRGLSRCDSCGRRLASDTKRTRIAIGLVVVIVVILAVVSASKYISGDRYEAPQDTGSKAAADSGNSQNP